MIKLKDISKKYLDDNKIEINALQDVSITFFDKGLYCIVGGSGSGKTTLLNLIARLEKPTSGEILYNNQSVDNIDLIKYHSEIISFVYQDLNLIYDLSLIDNIKILGINDLELIDIYLTKFGLINKKNTGVRFLSGGEKQRLAIIRAIMSNSQIIILDEPTSDLDIDITKQIFDILEVTSKEKLVIMVTHDVDNALIYSDYVIQMQNGKILKIQDLQQYSFKLKIDDALDDEIIEIYKRLKLQKNLNLIIIDENNQKHSKLIDQCFNFSVFTKILLSFNKQEIDLRLENNSDSTVIKQLPDVTVNKKNFLYSAFKLLLGYIRNRPVHFIVMIMLYFLSLTILLVFSNIVFFEKNQVLKQSVGENYYDYYPIYQDVISDYSKETKSIYKGEELNQILSNEIDIYPTKIAQLNVSSFNGRIIQPTILLFEDITVLKSKYPYLDQNDQIIITDGLLQALDNSENLDNIMLDITFQSEMTGSQNVNLNVDNIININDADFNMSSFLNNDTYFYNNIEKFKYKNGIIYMSQSYYLNLLNQSKTLEFPGNNFFLENTNYQVYLSNQNKLKYKRYENEDIIFGNSISDTNEVVVSVATYNKYFNDDYNLPKTINVRNIDDSPNSVLYQEFINLYKHTPVIKVVGIVDITSDVAVSEDLYDVILEDAIYFDISEYVISLDQNDHKYILLDDNNINIKLQKIVPIYEYSKFKNSSIFSVLLWLEAGLLLLTAVLQSNSSVNLIKNKRKDIGVLKTLGYSNIKILSSHIGYNYIQAFIAMGITFIIGIFFNYGINQTLKGDEFGFYYDLIIMYPMSVLIIIFISILTPIISVLLSLNEINKTDISVLIKKSI